MTAACRLACGLSTSTDGTVWGLVDDEFVVPAVCGLASVSRGLGGKCCALATTSRGLASRGMAGGAVAAVEGETVMAAMPAVTAALWSVVRVGLVASGCGVSSSPGMAVRLAYVWVCTWQKRKRRVLIGA